MALRYLGMAKSIAGSVAPTARHALHYLDVLAALLLALEAEVHPAVIAAVGCVLVGAGVVPGMG
jgi:hypothetical protein